MLDFTINIYISPQIIVMPLNFWKDRIVKKTKTNSNTGSGDKKK